MSKIFSVLLVFVLALGSYAQTLDEIITKCLEVAGQDKLSKVESMTIKAKILQGGIEIPMVMYQKRPDKYRSDATFQSMSIREVYDGTNGYMMNPFMGTKDPVPLNAEQLERLKDQAELDNIFLTYKRLNYQLEYTGTEDMEGMQVLVLKLSKPNGDVSRIFIDPENFVVLKIVSKLMIQGTEREVESYPSNYKYIEGILFPFSYEQKMGGQTIMQMNFESFELNSNPPDSLFVVPTQK